jgi:hypothetical protein
MTMQATRTAAPSRTLPIVSAMPRHRKVRWAGFLVAIGLLVTGITVGGATVVDHPFPVAPAAISTP